MKTIKFFKNYQDAANIAKTSSQQNKPITLRKFSLGFALFNEINKTVSVEALETLYLFKAGYDFKKIVATRRVQVRAIVNNFSTLIEEGFLTIQELKPLIDFPGGSIEEISSHIIEAEFDKIRLKTLLEKYNKKYLTLNYHHLTIIKSECYRKIYCNAL